VAINLFLVSSPVCFAPSLRVHVCVRQSKQNKNKILSSNGGRLSIVLPPCGFFSALFYLFFGKDTLMFYLITGNLSCIVFLYKFSHCKDYFSCWVSYIRNMYLKNPYKTFPYLKLYYQHRYQESLLCLRFLMSTSFVKFFWFENENLVYLLYQAMHKYCTMNKFKTRLYLAL
jgi:hypothetical protein